MTQILSAIHNEHKQTADLLNRLEQEISRLKAGENLDYDLIDCLLDYFASFPDSAHHRMEDIVYAHLKDNAKAQQAGLADLDAEHDVIAKATENLGALVARLENDQELAITQVAAGVEVFIEAYRAHMNMEETRFMPLADYLLEAKDWAVIAEELTEATLVKAHKDSEDKAHAIYQQIREFYT